MPYVDREGTPEHTTHPWACGCAEAKIEQQRELLNTAVVKLDSCYQDYKKYRSSSERQEARIAALEAIINDEPHTCLPLPPPAGPGFEEASRVGYLRGREESRAKCLRCRAAAALEGEPVEEGDA